MFAPADDDRAATAIVEAMGWPIANIEVAGVGHGSCWETGNLATALHELRGRS